VKEGTRFCSSSCEDVTENCANCTSTQCLACSEDMVVDTDDSYKCKQCSELFYGCSECDSYRCKKCQDSAWLLTDNGCAYEENEPDEEIELSSSSSQASSHDDDFSSQPLAAPSSSSKKDSDKSDVGMIVGIVVGVVVVVAIVAVAIYFVVTARSKRDGVDPSIRDGEDVDFVFMSVL